MKGKIIIQENATHIAFKKTDASPIEIHEKELFLKKDKYGPAMNFPAVCLCKNASEEDIFNFFEESDENNRINLNELND